MTNIKSKVIRVIAIITILSLNLGTCIYATDLNGVGETTNEVVTEAPKPVETPVQTTVTPEPTLPPLEETPIDKQKETEGTAKAVGDMFNNAGVDEESVKAANEFLAPFARVLNKVMAVILGVTSLLMMLVTVLDLLYMAFPPVRDMLDGGRSGMMQPGGMAGGMGGARGMGGRYGGMGGRYGGMGGGMMGGGMMGGGMMGGMDGGMGAGMGGRQQQQVGGGLSAIGRWVSDEAMAACMECQGGPTGDMQSSGPIKLMLFAYMKKRALFLILFGVCVILFTSTVFTELGIKIGMWALRLVMGFGA